MYMYMLLDELPEPAVFAPGAHFAKQELDTAPPRPIIML